MQIDKTKREFEAEVTFKGELPKRNRVEDVDVNEIEEALANATPGEWKFKVNRIERREDGEFDVGNLEGKGENILDVFKNKYGIPTIFAWNESNIKLITNAPTWLRLLLTKYKDTEEWNEVLHKQIDEFGAKIAELIVENAALESKYTETLAQVEELQSELEDEQNESDRLNRIIYEQGQFIEQHNDMLNQAIETLKQVTRLAATGNHILIKGVVRDTLQLIGGDEEDADS